MNPPSSSATTALLWTKRFGGGSDLAFLCFQRTPGTTEEDKLTSSAEIQAPPIGDGPLECTAGHLSWRTCDDEDCVSWLHDFLGLSAAPLQTPPVGPLSPRMVNYYQRWRLHVL